MSIKVSANIASPEGMRPEWAVRPGMRPPPPPQWSVPRTRLVMEHEIKGSLLKISQSPNINARSIPLFGPLLTNALYLGIDRLQVADKKRGQKVCKAVVNKSSKRPWTTENRWSSSMGIGRQADNFSP